MKSMVLAVLALAGCAHSKSSAQLAAEAAEARSQTYAASPDAVMDAARQVVDRRYGLDEDGGRDLVRSRWVCRTKSGDWCQQRSTASSGGKAHMEGGADAYYSFQIIADVNPEAEGSRVDVRATLMRPGRDHGKGDAMPGWLVREVDATQVEIDERLRPPAAP